VKKTLKVAIVGSTGFFPEATTILRLIEDNPGEILTRNTRSNGIDAVVAGLCLMYGHPCEMSPLLEIAPGHLSACFLNTP